MNTYNVTIMAFDDSDNNGLNQCYDNGKIVETIQADNEINAIKKARKTRYTLTEEEFRYWLNYTQKE
jgi:hypothetical protein